ncbi:MAG: hypothetical protein HYZ83_06735 [Candidatus Omnitrophica bacterium]|nr:hypothetical protein [Candidatus Omnitrophota bacterium]
MKISEQDAEILWKRVGLAELRAALKNINDLTNQFEKALASLPQCDQCARVQLLEQIQKTGNRLSGEVISLISLSATLKDAVSAAEAAEKKLIEQCPETCKCEGDQCTCHAK